jgi:hypothetical protein
MIRIIGPRDRRDPHAINTTSHSDKDWSSGLSPFKLGPVALYGSFSARIFENAWQYAKLYPEHADRNGHPTADYWRWAQAGWTSTTPKRYPLGKGRKPLCSLWNGTRLGYIDARKNIYLPLYRDLVRQTEAFQHLQEIYAHTGDITLFDFDADDHAKIGMTLHDVLNCPTRICGHAFILAMMLTHGPLFTIEDLEPTDGAGTNGDANEMPISNLFPITIVNTKTFQGDSEYIGRPMRNRAGSALGNPFKVKPHGTYERNESVFVMYRQWLWREMQNKDGNVFKELLRLKKIAEQGPLNLACWCAPEACHGEVIKKAIEFLATQAV